MKIEKYFRIDDWLNIRVNPKGNESLFDFLQFGCDSHAHTLTEAKDLYDEFMKNNDWTFE